MRNNLDSKAFTLVELLTVVVLLGVIMMLAIPSLRNLTYNNSEQQYNYHVKFVEEATKLYARNYKSELEKDKTSTCFNIPYQALLEEDLIEEEEISCEGNVILEKRSREGYNHKYYLTCRDSSGKVVHESEPIPLNCKGISGKFAVNYSLYKDGESEQVPYTEGEWAKYIYGEYNSSSPYNYPVERIEYTTDLINWNMMSNRKQTYTNFNGNVFIRAIDQGGNTSEVVRHLVRGDSKGPKFALNSDENKITEEGTIEVAIQNVRDEGVGIESGGNIYSYDGVNWLSTSKKYHSIPSEGKIYVKDKLGNVAEQPIQVIRACSGSGATAKSNEILTGKTAWVNGTKITGTMANQGAKSTTLNPGGSYTIPVGYHNGSGKITVSSLASNTSANASADQILSGRTAWVNGTKLTGTMANQGAKSVTLNPGGSYTIPAGYHNGGGKITVSSLANNTSANASADQILSGRTAWVNGVMLTGTMANRGNLNWAGINTTYTVPAGYYSGGTIDSRPSYQKGFEDGKKNATSSIQALYNNQSIKENLGTAGCSSYAHNHNGPWDADDDSFTYSKTLNLYQTSSGRRAALNIINFNIICDSYNAYDNTWGRYNMTYNVTSSNGKVLASGNINGADGDNANRTITINLFASGLGNAQNVTISISGSTSARAATSADSQGRASINISNIYADYLPME